MLLLVYVPVQSYLLLPLFSFHHGVVVRKNSYASTSVYHLLVCGVGCAPYRCAQHSVEVAIPRERADQQ
jgi:hypothetical protein